jgi:hypothetical protein
MEYMTISAIWAIVEGSSKPFRDHFATSIFRAPDLAAKLEAHGDFQTE